MQKRVKTAIPIYGAGALFLLCALIFPMYRIQDIIVAIIVAIVGYFVLDKLFPGKVIEVSGDKNVDELLATGRGYVERLESLKIQDLRINQQIGKLQSISRQIFEYVAKNPNQSRKITTFMNYYLPTSIKFLEQYAEFDAKETQGENIKVTMQNISDSLSKFEEAFTHQLDALYSEKALDIETDITVLEGIMNGK